MSAPPTKLPTPREVLKEYAQLRPGFASYCKLLERGYSEKRVCFVLQKLVDAGWMEYGVALSSAWLTDAGWKEVKSWPVI